MLPRWPPHANHMYYWNADCRKSVNNSVFLISRLLLFWCLKEFFIMMLNPFPVLKYTLLSSKGLKIQDGWQIWLKCHAQFHNEWHAILNTGLNLQKQIVFYWIYVSITIKMLTPKLSEYMASVMPLSNYRPWKMSKSKLGIFITQLVLVRDLQYFHLHLCFLGW